MKSSLMSVIQAQMGNLQNTDTKELGEAVDMIKDLSEAIYYCTITKAMKEQNNETQKNTEIMYYPVNSYIDKPRDPYYDMERDMDRRTQKRMYYPGGNNSQMSNTNRSSNSSTGDEGRSPHSRRNYMESRRFHNDKNVHLKELDKYVQELASDMVEMIQDASPEEKQLLQKKISMLSNKLQEL